MKIFSLRVGTGRRAGQEARTLAQYSLLIPGRAVDGEQQ